MINNSSVCIECADKKKKETLKTPYDVVRQYIDIESNSGCKLLSKEYINNCSNLEVACRCGNVFYTTYASFKSKDKQQCDECTHQLLRDKFNLDYEYVKNYIEHYNCLLLSDEYVNMCEYLKIQCLDCGHIYNSTFANFKNTKHKCPKCAIKSSVEILSFSQNYVEEYLLEYGYVLLSDYINCDTQLKIKCPEGHIFYMDFYHFKNREQRCSVCYSLSDKSGENSASWQGGKTSLNHMLREMLNEWKFKSLKHYDFKCLITNTTKELEVHHVKSFNKVVEEILEKLNISSKKQVGEYTKEEVNDIKKLFLIHHNENLGVPMTREVHMLFHSVYGWDNNENQLNEFIKNYDNHIKERLKA